MGSGGTGFFASFQQKNAGVGSPLGARAGGEGAKPPIIAFYDRWFCGRGGRNGPITLFIYSLNHQAIRDTLPGICLSQPVYQL